VWVSGGGASLHIHRITCTKCGKSYIQAILSRDGWQNVLKCNFADERWVLIDKMLENRWTSNGSADNLVCNEERSFL